LTHIRHRTDAGRPAIEHTSRRFQLAFRRAMAGTHWVGFLRRNTFRYFALRTTKRNYTVILPPIAGARRQCLINDRSPSVEIPGSANQVDRQQAARQKSEAATEARTSAGSIRARSKLGRCGCARFPANRVQARIW